MRSHQDRGLFAVLPLGLSTLKFDSKKISHCRLQGGLLLESINNIGFVLFALQEYYLVALAQQRPEEDSPQVIKSAMSTAMSKLVILTFIASPLVNQDMKPISLTCCD